MSDLHIMEFDIVAKPHAGLVRPLRIAAADAAEAMRLAEKSGLKVLSCKLRGGALVSNLRRRPAAGPTFDVALFAHDLASLLDAGLGIVDAIGTLAENGRHAETRRMLGQLTQALKEGKKVSAAMAQRPDIFPQMLIASVSASEHTGNLSGALRRYSENFEVVRAIRSKIIGASVYPLMLLGVGMLVVLFLLGVVVPRFSTLIETTRGNIPFASALLIRTGKLINAHQNITSSVALAFALAIAAGLRHASRLGWNLPAMQRLPFIGPLVRMYRQAQFYRTAGMLIESGITAICSFEMCGSLLTPEDHRQLAGALSAIQSGAPIGPSFHQAGLADAIAQRMLTVAQRTGKLAEMLIRIAGFKDVALNRAIDVTTRLFEPILMIVIGLVIGAIVVLMYLPIFDLASSLQ